MTVAAKWALAVLALVCLAATGCTTGASSGNTATSTPGASTTHPAPGAAPGAVAPGQAVDANAVVTRVVDGDTVKLSIGGKAETVRLIGIDTPETVHPRRPVGCYGKEASAYTSSLLPTGTPVRVVIDVEPRDRYGRLLVYLYRAADNLFVNADLARGGYANVLTIPPNVAHADEFVALVSDAREQGRGLWSRC